MSIYQKWPEAYNAHLRNGNIHKCSTHSLHMAKQAIIHSFFNINNFKLKNESAKFKIALFYLFKEMFAALIFCLYFSAKIKVQTLHQMLACGVHDFF